MDDFHRARVQGQGCPVCSGFKTIPGVNDIPTLFPDIAKQANGWDPKGVSPGSNKRYEWICSLGHTWKAGASNRTHQQTVCPYCSNLKCWPGFNDLATVNPEIAKEACGWDPTKVIYSYRPKENLSAANVDWSGMCNQASEPGEAQAALAARNLGMIHLYLDISISCKGQANNIWDYNQFCKKNG